MPSLLLLKTRKLNKILQHSAEKPISFPTLSEMLMEILDSNVYILSLKGKVLGTSLITESDSPAIDKEGDEYFPETYAQNVLDIRETKSNITNEELLELFENELESYSKFACIVPIHGSGQRLGSLILAREEKHFTDDDLVLAEYAATVVGMEIIRSEKSKIEEDMRLKTVVQLAIGTLSYTELEALIAIVKELEGSEGLLVASKIADKEGITRSVIVNALRKFESAGIIESRSLGMKGTYIRILNDKLHDELSNYMK